MLEVKTMREDFENFNDEDEEWLSELEINDTDLENELSDWHAAQARQITESSYGHDKIQHRGRSPRRTPTTITRRPSGPAAGPRLGTPGRTGPRPSSTGGAVASAGSAG